ncbi:MAG: chemotaxis-specific protein-glutamate methyltransferase CheB [Chthoniobacteraceae bacterium]
MIPADTQLIKVLVVDDSRVASEFLTHLFNSDREFLVVGTARNGEEAVEAARQMDPDVITMDIHMPGMNGYEATRKIMETCPKPIVIVSGSLNTDEVAINFRAIEAGALAVAQRPTGAGSPQSETDARELLKLVRLMSEVKVVRRWPRSRFVSASSSVPREIVRSQAAIKAVIIGASTGGPLALQTVLSGLPENFAAPVLIVQHMSRGFVHGFVEWLGHTSGFPVHVAIDGEFLKPGCAYVAPDDFHMGVGVGNCIRLAADAPENGMRPSVSYLFRSAKAAFGANTAAVLLTGMGKDGAVELKYLRDVGAITIVQDKETSVVFGMPDQAIQLDAAMYVLPPDGIARTLATLVKKT